MKRSAGALRLHWEELKKAVAARGKALEDKRDFLEFLQKVEEVEAWIRQKVGGGGGVSIHRIRVFPLSDVFVFQEVMVNVGDVGKDYEHGVQLLKRLGEFRGGGDGVSNRRQRGNTRARQLI